jgi:YbbR domain-containing protein
MKRYLLVVFSMLFFSCEFNNSKNKIPNNSFLINDYWFFVESIHSHKNNAKISVFSNKTGELIVSKKFILVCYDENQIFISNLKEQIESFDGEKIHLKSKKSPKCWLQ